MAGGNLSMRLPTDDAPPAVVRKKPISRSLKVYDANFKYYNSPNFMKGQKSAFEYQSFLIKSNDITPAWTLTNYSVKKLILF